MRILWFSLSPCGSLRRNKETRVIQGWMISLEDELKKHSEIELNVAFFSDIKEDSYEYEGVRYYPMYQQNAKTKIGRVLDRFKSMESIDKKLLPVMLDVVKRVHPDLIHIHGTEERFGLIQDYVKDIPVVFSIQGLIAPYTEKFYSGIPANFAKRQESIFTQMKGVSSYKRYKDYYYRGERELSYLQKAKYVIGRTQFDHVIPLLCNQSVELFQGEEILRADFYNGNWNKSSFDEKIKLVTTISPGIYKGYETLLHTAKLLSMFAPFDFEWNVIGYNPNENLVHIAEKYKNVSSEDCSIRLLGKKNACCMVDIMTCSDIYVQVSHIENSPNSVCEAMLLGMPIIASFAGGTSSILQDGKEGMLVQDGDPYTLAGSIVWLVKNFNIAKQYGNNARCRAKKRHNRQMIGEHLKNIYEEIIENEKGMYDIKDK